jgi:hypothetical protein
MKFHLRLILTVLLLCAPPFVVGARPAADGCNPDAASCYDQMTTECQDDLAPCTVEPSCDPASLESRGCSVAYCEATLADYKSSCSVPRCPAGISEATARCASHQTATKQECFSDGPESGEGTYRHTDNTMDCDGPEPLAASCQDQTATCVALDLATKDPCASPSIVAAWLSRASSMPGAGNYSWHLTVANRAGVVLSSFVYDVHTSSAGVNGIVAQPTTVTVQLWTNNRPVQQTPAGNADSRTITPLPCSVPVVSGGVASTTCPPFVTLQWTLPGDRTPPARNLVGFIVTIDHGKWDATGPQYREDRKQGSDVRYAYGTPRSSTFIPLDHPDLIHGNNNAYSLRFFAVMPAAMTARIDAVYGARGTTQGNTVNIGAPQPCIDPQLGNIAPGTQGSMSMGYTFQPWNPDMNWFVRDIVLVRGYEAVPPGTNPTQATSLESYRSGKHGSIEARPDSDLPHLVRHLFPQTGGAGTASDQGLPPHVQYGYQVVVLTALPYHLRSNVGVVKSLGAPWPPPHLEATRHPEPYNYTEDTYNFNAVNEWMPGKMQIRFEQGLGEPTAHEVRIKWGSDAWTTCIKPTRDTKVGTAYNLTYPNDFLIGCTGAVAKPLADGQTDFRLQVRAINTLGKSLPAESAGIEALVSIDIASVLGSGINPVLGNSFRFAETEQHVDRQDTVTINKRVVETSLRNLAGTNTTERQLPTRTAELPGVPCSAPSRLMIVGGRQQDKYALGADIMVDTALEALGPYSRSSEGINHTFNTTVKFPDGSMRAIRFDQYVPKIWDGSKWSLDHLANATRLTQGARYEQQLPSIGASAPTRNWGDYLGAKQDEWSDELPLTGRGVFCWIDDYYSEAEVRGELQNIDRFGSFMQLGPTKWSLGHTITTTYTRQAGTRWIDVWSAPECNCLYQSVSPTAEVHKRPQIAKGPYQHTLDLTSIGSPTPMAGMLALQWGGEVDVDTDSAFFKGYPAIDYQMPRSLADATARSNALSSQAGQLWSNNDAFVPRDLAHGNLNARYVLSPWLDIRNSQAISDSEGRVFVPRIGSFVAFAGGVTEPWGALTTAYGYKWTYQYRWEALTENGTWVPTKSVPLCAPCTGDKPDKYAWHADPSKAWSTNPRLDYGMNLGPGEHTLKVLLNATLKAPNGTVVDSIKGETTRTFHLDAMEAAEKLTPDLGAPIIVRQSAALLGGDRNMTWAWWYSSPQDKDPYAAYSKANDQSSSQNGRLPIYTDLVHGFTIGGEDADYEYDAPDPTAGITPPERVLNRPEPIVGDSMFRLVHEVYAKGNTQTAWSVFSIEYARQAFGYFSKSNHGQLNDDGTTFTAKAGDYLTYDLYVSLTSSPGGALLSDKKGSSAPDSMECRADVGFGTDGTALQASKATQRKTAAINQWQHVNVSLSAGDVKQLIWYDGGCLAGVDWQDAVYVAYIDNVTVHALGKAPAKVFGYGRTTAPTMAVYLDGFKGAPAGSEEDLDAKLLRHIWVTNRTYDYSLPSSPLPPIDDPYLRVQSSQFGRSTTPGHLAQNHIVQGVIIGEPKLKASTTPDREDRRGQDVNGYFDDDFVATPGYYNYGFQVRIDAPVQFSGDDAVAMAPRVEHFQGNGNYDAAKTGIHKAENGDEWRTENHRGAPLYNNAFSSRILIDDGDISQPMEYGLVAVPQNPAPILNLDMTRTRYQSIETGGNDTALAVAPVTPFAPYQPALVEKARTVDLAKLGNVTIQRVRTAVEAELGRMTDVVPIEIKPYEPRLRICWEWVRDGQGSGLEPLEDIPASQLTAENTTVHVVAYLETGATNKTNLARCDAGGSPRQPFEAYRQEALRSIVEARPIRMVVVTVDEAGEPTQEEIRLPTAGNGSVEFTWERANDIAFLMAYDAEDWTLHGVSHRQGTLLETHSANERQSWSLIVYIFAGIGIMMLAFWVAKKVVTSRM